MYCLTYLPLYLCTSSTAVLGVVLKSGEIEQTCCCRIAWCTAFVGETFSGVLFPRDDVIELLSNFEKHFT